MRKLSVLIPPLLFLSLTRVHADVVTSTTSVVAVSTAPVVATSTDTVVEKGVEVSTAPRSVGITGETLSAPIPNAMTQSPAPGAFVSLTRTALAANTLPTNTDVVQPETFKKFDAQNAGEAIGHETGVEIFPYGGPAPITAHIRGSSANQTLVLVDGRPATGMFLSAPDLTEIPAEQIDHIEIVRGGVSALYGPNALGGVINIITKRATYSGLPISHVSYENGSYGQETFRLDAASRSGPFDYYFFGNRTQISGFRDNTDARLYNIGGNVGTSMGKAGKLLFDVSSYHNNQGLPGPRCDISDPFCLSTPFLQPDRFNNKDEKIASTPLARSVTDTNYLRMSYLVNLPADTLMTMRLYGSQREVVDNDPDVLTLTDADRHEQAHGGELQFNLPHGLLLGGTFEHDRENVQDLVNPGNSFIAWEENWGAFAQETFHHGPFTLIPSGRYDKNSQFGDTANPRVQTLADATDWLRFSGSVGRSNRAPSIDERTPLPAFNYLGNQNLVPETAWSYDAGFELHNTSESVKVTYYRVNVENFIQTIVQQDPTNPLSPYMAQNLAEARRQGMEVQIDHAVNEYYSHSLNYTYLESLGIVPGDPDPVLLAFSPRHTVNFLQTFRPWKRWKVDSTLRYEDSRYAGNNQQGTKMGSELLWDLRFAYQLRQMELFIGAHDVMDKRYVEQPGFPLPGLNLFGGINLKLWG